MTIKDEIAKPEYEGMSDAEVAAAINGATFTVRGPIRANDVKRLWGRRMILARCRAKAGDQAAPAAIRTLCRATYDNLMGDLFGDLDPADPTQAPEITAYLSGLIAADVMTEQDRDDTLALAETLVSGPAAFGFTSPLNEADIANARAE